MKGFDVPADFAVHAVSYRHDDRMWGRGWRAECSCGWRGDWRDRRDDAHHDGSVHQTSPAGEVQR